MAPRRNPQSTTAAAAGRTHLPGSEQNHRHHHQAAQHRASLQPLLQHRQGRGERGAGRGRYDGGTVWRATTAAPLLAARRWDLSSVHTIVAQHTIVAHLRHVAHHPAAVEPLRVLAAVPVLLALSRRRRRGRRHQGLRRGGAHRATRRGGCLQVGSTSGQGECAGRMSGREAASGSGSGGGSGGRVDQRCVGGTSAKRSRDTSNAPRSRWCGKPELPERHETSGFTLGLPERLPVMTTGPVMN